MRGRLLVLALMVNSCAPTIAPAPRPCTQTKRVITRPFANNVMFLIDRSTATPQLSELIQAVQVFVTRQPTFARYGVAVYPHDNACGASEGADVLLHVPDAGSLDLDVDLQAQSDLAVAALGSISSQGEPAMAGSLRFVSALPELNDPHRGSVVVALSQGLPGCDGDGGYGDAVSTIQDLFDQQRYTLIVPFDADLSDAGTVAAFDELAAASGSSQFCRASDSECAPGVVFGSGADAGAGNTCDTSAQRCQPRFFHATNADELESVIVSELSPTVFIEHQDPCAYSLDWTGINEADLSVYVDGQELAECDADAGCDTWRYQSATPPKVIFEGATCDHLKNATEFNPVQLAFVVPSCDR
ncbi:MAG: hypothetical protein QM723_38835 [Myxococcaceae bacterium]